MVGSHIRVPAPGHVLVVLMALLLWGTSGAQAGQNGHADLACGACHLAGDNVTAENARQLSTSQDWLCSSCHGDAMAASHPTGFVPARPLPAEFPLDWKGEVTCSTCHDLHNDQPAHLRAGNDGVDGCLACHSVDFFEEMADSGMLLMGFGHLNAGGDRMSTVDRYSERCAVCHRQSLTISGDVVRVAYTSFNGTGMANHPVGTAYRQAMFHTDLRPAAELPKEMLLPDGRVSCLSCHRGYSRQHGALAVELGRLCISCHDK